MSSKSTSLIKTRSSDAPYMSANATELGVPGLAALTAADSSPSASLHDFLARYPALLNALGSR